MLFEEQLSRKPNLYPWTQKFIDVMEDGHWTVKKFDFQRDIQDYKVAFNDDTLFIPTLPPTTPILATPEL